MSQPIFEQVLGLSPEQKAGPLGTLAGLLQVHEFDLESDLADLLSTYATSDAPSPEVVERVSRLRSILARCNEMYLQAVVNDSN